MSRKSTEMAYANLGDYLRETRVSLGVDLVRVAEETKISPKSLQAMEENNFANLPAEAFTRGFYILYAKSLALDGKEILKMYMQQRPKQQKSGNLPTLIKTRLAQEVGSMAERPAFKPFSFLGLVVLLLLLFGGFLCWYFSWNPATYLSQKLRSLEQPQRIEQISAVRTTVYPQESSFRFPRLHKPWPSGSDLFGLSYPSIATAAIAQDVHKDAVSPPLPRSKDSTSAEPGETTPKGPLTTGEGFTDNNRSGQPQQ